MAIIALLVSILLPSLSRAKEIARRVVCSANLHALGRGWQLYWTGNNHRLPNMFNVLPGVPDVSSQP